MYNKLILFITLLIASGCSSSKDAVIEIFDAVPTPQLENHYDLTAQNPSSNVPDIELDQVYLGLITPPLNEDFSFSLDAVTNIAVVDVEYVADQNGTISFSNYARSWQGRCLDLTSEIVWFELNSTGDVLNVDVFGMFDTKSVVQNGRYLFRFYFEKMGNCRVTQTLAIEVK
jgi:hypothetical protein